MYFTIIYLQIKLSINLSFLHCLLNFVVNKQMIRTALSKVLKLVPLRMAQKRNVYKFISLKFFYSTSNFNSINHNDHIDIDQKLSIIESLQNSEKALNLQKILTLIQNKKLPLSAVKNEKFVSIIRSHPELFVQAKKLELRLLEDQLSEQINRKTMDWEKMKPFITQFTTIFEDWNKKFKQFSDRLKVFESAMQLNRSQTRIFEKYEQPFLPESKKEQVYRNVCSHNQKMMQSLLISLVSIGNSCKEALTKSNRKQETLKLQDGLLNIIQAYSFFIPLLFKSSLKIFKLNSDSVELARRCQNMRQHIEVVQQNYKYLQGQDVRFFTITPFELKLIKRMIQLGMWNLKPEEINRAEKQFLTFSDDLMREILESVERLKNQDENVQRLCDSVVGIMKMKARLIGVDRIQQKQLKDRLEQFRDGVLKLIKSERSRAIVSSYVDSKMGQILLLEQEGKEEAPKDSFFKNIKAQEEKGISQKISGGFDQKQLGNILSSISVLSQSRKSHFFNLIIRKVKQGKLSEYIIEEDLFLKAVEKLPDVLVNSRLVGLEIKVELMNKKVEGKQLSKQQVEDLLKYADVIGGQCFSRLPQLSLSFAMRVKISVSSLKRDVRAVYLHFFKKGNEREEYFLKWKDDRDNFLREIWGDFDLLVRMIKQSEKEGKSSAGFSLKNAMLQFVDAIAYDVLLHTSSAYKWFSGQKSYGILKRQINEALQHCQKLFKYYGVVPELTDSFQFYQKLKIRKGELQFIISGKRESQNFDQSKAVNSELNAECEKNFSQGLKHLARLCEKEQTPTDKIKEVIEYLMYVRTFEYGRGQSKEVLAGVLKKDKQAIFGVLKDESAKKKFREAFNLMVEQRKKDKQES